MKIADLNYMEVLTSDASRAKGGLFTNPFEVDKTVNSTVNNTITFDTDITFDKFSTTDVLVVANADIDGNITTLTLDAEAIGSDTLVEVDSSVLSIHGELSSLSLSVISAATTPAP
ncbi:hypothetical protein [Synechococcus sp. PCC 7336]|uniref:hypothetical protein n=1 Tax=Synechococcus sp. PCC 7336 TaxID=195250 RepID=UPI00036975F4|nr:hypothetical protein [Synechococcus sp. PCC 7336]